MLKTLGRSASKKKKNPTISVTKGWNCKIMGQVKTGLKISSQISGVKFRNCVLVSITGNVRVAFSTKVHLFISAPCLC